MSAVSPNPNQMPDKPGPKGLLALMLYCDARGRTRRDANGRFVPPGQQNARLWDCNQTIEAESLLTVAARAGRFSRGIHEPMKKMLTGGSMAAGMVGSDTLFARIVPVVSNARPVGRGQLLCKLGTIASVVHFFICRNLCPNVAIGVLILIG